jgi:hypothetical protein
MFKRAASRLTTSSRSQKAQLTGRPEKQERLEDNLLKLRAVLILIAASSGSKLTTACTLVGELKRKRLKSSIRSLYRWRRRYLAFGFAGIPRQKRNDAGCARRIGPDLFNRIVDAAARVKRYGDMAREFRKLRPGISRESFRTWIWKIRRQLKVVEMPRREGVR